MFKDSLNLEVYSFVFFIIFWDKDGLGIMFIGFFGIYGWMDIKSLCFIVISGNDIMFICLLRVVIDNDRFFFEFRIIFDFDCSKKGIYVNMDDFFW